MTNVYIRNENEAKATLLCHCEIDRLDWLLKEVARWGVYHNGDVKTGLSGQFVYADGEAYFEIVINGDDEATNTDGHSTGCIP